MYITYSTYSCSLLFSFCMIRRAHFSADDMKYNHILCSLLNDGDEDKSVIWIDEGSRRFAQDLYKSISSLENVLISLLYCYFFIFFILAMNIICCYKYPHTSYSYSIWHHITFFGLFTFVYAKRCIYKIISYGIVVIIIIF